MDTPRFTITSAAGKQDIDLIHRFLSCESSWARGIPIETVRKSIENSLCFGGFVGPRQVAFARVVTDRATFAYLVDVFVVSEYRGRGYGSALMAAILAEPELQGLRRFMLATSTAHGLYRQFGFTPPAKPESIMERFVPDAYTAAVQRDVSRR